MPSKRSAPCFSASSWSRRTPLVGGHLGAQIAAPLVRGADVGEDDAFHVGIGNARRAEPHRRQAQALAEDLGGGPVAARCGAADVRPVRPHAREAQQGAIEEGRGDDVHVGQVAPAEVGIVVDEDVARLEAAPGLDHRLHGQRHGAQVNGQIRSLGHHLAVDVEEPAGVVAGHLEDGRVGGLGEDDLHLLCGGVERVLDDLEGGGIAVAHGGRAADAVARAVSRLGEFDVTHGSRLQDDEAPVPARRRQPGGTTMVVSAASRMSGPARSNPGAIASRDSTAQGARPVSAK